MARVRAQYHFGELIIQEDQTECRQNQTKGRLDNIKMKFKNIGINLPLISGKLLIMTHYDSL